MNKIISDINEKFDAKIKELEKTLPKVKSDINCSAMTLCNILDVLGIEDYKFFNLAIPFAGGFGGYSSIKGWTGPCGVISGGVAAIGIICGGKKKMKFREHLNSYQLGLKYLVEFERQFNTILCRQLCGCDWSKKESVTKYIKNDVWEKKCYKFVLFGVNKVRELTQKELEKKWFEIN